MRSHAWRFTAHFTALSAGALAVVFAMALRPQTAAWIVLGLGILTVVAALGAFAMPGQGGGPRAVEILLVLVGGWTIVAARVFSDPHVTKWLCFADGAALWALGGLGLFIHERLIEGHLRRAIEEEGYRMALTRRPASSEVPFQRAGR